MKPVPQTTDPAAILIGRYGSSQGFSDHYAVANLNAICPLADTAAIDADIEPGAGTRLDQVTEAFGRPVAVWLIDSYVRELRNTLGKAAFMNDRATTAAAEAIIDQRPAARVTTVLLFFALAKAGRYFKTDDFFDTAAIIRAYRRYVDEDLPNLQAAAERRRAAATRTDLRRRTAGYVTPQEIADLRARYIAGENVGHWGIKFWIEENAASANGQRIPDEILQRYLPQQDYLQLKAEAEAADIRRQQLGIPKAKYGLTAI